MIPKPEKRPEEVACSAPAVRLGAAGTTLTSFSVEDDVTGQTSQSQAASLVCLSRQGLVTNPPISLQYEPGHASGAAAATAGFHGDGVIIDMLLVLTVNTGEAGGANAASQSAASSFSLFPV